MDGGNDRPHARPPTLDDLVRICDALNRAGARYVLIGGFAMIAHGAALTTNDIGLLLDPAAENVARVRSALGILPDNAVAEVADTDLQEYSVVRVADEVVVDLMSHACDVRYADAASNVELINIKGVSIPLASLRTMIETKKTIRPRDAVDRAYLEEKLAQTE